MAEARALKELAIAYKHPEVPVVTTDPTATARCYFGRPSAPNSEEEGERQLILEEARALKKVAVDYKHPELPVTTTDPTACGRNYFDRPSAIVEEDWEEAEERARVLADAKALKGFAVDYMHPERPVTTTDPTACGRNYFNRPSAVVEEEWEEAEERARILAEAKSLKKLAVDYMHPERPVVVEDPTVFGRNYFTRPSAVEMEEDSEELGRILADARALKKNAVDYMHPELPVSVDPTACGRNYFDRPSAVSEQEWEEAEERARILAEAKSLKKLAVDYMHPELPVSTDATAFGRNYFSRPSAPINEESDERSRILEEARALKKLATDYLHPELPVATDAMATARCYFDRPSAVTEEEWEEAEERARIIEEAKSLKKLAVDYLHPELPVVTTDPTATARCYFDRPSAVTEEEWEEAEERARIMEETKSLKKLAVDYLHPELPVVTTDPTATARCYYDRPSAVTGEEWEEAEERARVLADAKVLKKLAVDYLHPELPVATEPTAFARNYFGRPSAVVSDPEEEAERESILAEARVLKKQAVAFMHPEFPVTTDDPAACGRNYFDRPSARGHDHMIHTFPVHEDDEHHDEHHHEHLDHFGMDEEMDTRYDDIRQQLDAAVPGNKPNKGHASGSEEGNLSRSPSSVMLFNDEPIYD